MRGPVAFAARPVLLLIGLLLSGQVVGGSPGADPAINRPYLDPDFSQWVERFERPGREVYDRRDTILSATGVKPGMHVADVGAGTGLFSLMFAERVGETGKVYAVDISPTFVQNIEQRARSARFSNVTGIVNTQLDSGLSANSVDLVFICDTYHHFEQPATMLASIAQALRPGGSLVVIDFEREEDRSSGWVLGHVRAGREQVKREIEAAGFRYAGTAAILQDNFFLKFTKPPATAR